MKGKNKKQQTTATQAIRSAVQRGSIPADAAEGFLNLGRFVDAVRGRQ